LLIKVIFAKEKLSVQVHPDDKMAQKYGDPRGKTECWYVLEAEPGAQVACGLKPGVTLDQVKDGNPGGHARKQPERARRLSRRDDFCGCGNGSRHLAGHRFCWRPSRTAT
jgi:hypothetical protein